MRKAAIITAMLVLVLMFSGCREITTDLHDIYTITLSPGSNAAVDGQREITLQTNIHGRIAKFPEAQRGKWEFDCRVIIEDGYYKGYYHGKNYTVPDDPSTPYRYYYTPGVCATVFGCDKGAWEFFPDTEASNFITWTMGSGKPVSEATVFAADTKLFAKWQGGAAAAAEDSAAAQIKKHFGGAGIPVLPVTITVKANENLEPQIFSFNSRPVTITIKGERLPVYVYCNGFYCPHTPKHCTPANYGTCSHNPPCYEQPFLEPSAEGSLPTLTLNTLGAMFTVGDRVTLILEDISIHGYHNNNSSAIVVENGGKLEIKNNVRIVYNSAYSTHHGGAVTVQKGGTFDMSGGHLFQNFCMNPRMRFNLDVGGGAVWVRGGTFNLSGGLIEENMSLGGGGAVRVSHGGTFNMSRNPRSTSTNNLDPVIYNNAAWSGGGVFVVGGEDVLFSTSTFNMYAGFIEENYTPLWGGGVAVGKAGRFNMHGGDIWLNDAGEGGGIDNEGVVMIQNDNAWVYLNDSVAGRTGGISNWWHTEIWGGVVAYNEGGYGGGIRNFGDFIIMRGDILGNIANGGSGGGILNLGQFYMYGGNIAHNVSYTGEGGGIFHGTSGTPSMGKFIITAGLIWNNRDLTTYHTDGIPGSYGNIRVNTTDKTFNLARLGYFSLVNTHNRANGCSTVCTTTRGQAPVFENKNPDTAGAVPDRWQDIYWHWPPIFTVANTSLSDGTFVGTFPRYTVGRPRVEINTPNNPGSEPRIMMDASLTAIDESTLSRFPDGYETAGVYGTIPHGGTPRGGSWFPTKLSTLHTDPSHPLTGYSWIVQHGHIEALLLDWLTIEEEDGSLVSLDVLSNWPKPPAIFGFNFYEWIITPSYYAGNRRLTQSQAWPWNVPPQPRPLPNILPEKAEEPDPEPEPVEKLLREKTLFERFQGRSPERIERLRNKLNQNREVTQWPVPALELQMEQRSQMYIEPRNEKRFNEMLEKLLLYQDSGNGGDGGGPTPL